MSPRKQVGLVSGVIPHISSRGALVSAKPPITSWRYLGMPPTGRIPGEMPRSREAIPREYDLLDFLVGVVFAPVVLPAMLVRSAAEAVEEQARYESDVESQLRDQLLENKMRYESGELSEEAYREREAELTKRLKEIIE